MTTIGENGSNVYTFDGVDDPRVALSVLLVRNQSHEIIYESIEKILNYPTTDSKKRELEIDLFLIAFQTRNIRGGKGEREISMTMFTKLYEKRPELLLYVLYLVPYYGYWKDLFFLWEKIKNETLHNKIYKIVNKALLADEENMTKQTKT